MQYRWFILPCIVLLVVGALLLFSSPVKKETERSAKPETGNAEGAPPAKPVKQRSDIQPRNPQHEPPERGVKKEGAAIERESLPADLQGEVRLLKELLGDSFEEHHNEIGQCVKRISAMGKDRFDDLKTHARKREESLAFRTAILDAIGAIDGTGSADFLIETLLSQTEDPVVRGKSLALLTMRKDEKAFNAVKIVYETDRQYPGRYQLINAMGALGNAEAVPTLIHALKYETDKEIRYHAATALGDFAADRSAYEMLKYFSQYDQDPQVRKNAIVAVAKAKSEETALFLENLSQTEKDSDIRRIIETVLHP